MSARDDIAEYRSERDYANCDPSLPYEPPVEGKTFRSPALRRIEQRPSRRSWNAAHVCVVGLALVSIWLYFKGWQ